MTMDKRIMANEIYSYLKLWQARKTMTMDMRIMANEIYSYLKLWQARKTITMEMRMLASDLLLPEAVAGQEDNNYGNEDAG